MSYRSGTKFLLITRLAVHTEPAICDGHLLTLTHGDGIQGRGGEYGELDAGGRGE